VQPHRDRGAQPVFVLPGLRQRAEFALHALRRRDRMARILRHVAAAEHRHLLVIVHGEQLAAVLLDRARHQREELAGQGENLLRRQHVRHTREVAQPGEQDHRRAPFGDGALALPQRGHWHVPHVEPALA
jgi:hypothetical protein